MSETDHWPHMNKALDHLARVWNKSLSLESFSKSFDYATSQLEELDPRDIQAILGGDICNHQSEGFSERIALSHAIIVQYWIRAGEQDKANLEYINAHKRLFNLGLKRRECFIHERIDAHCLLSLRNIISNSVLEKVGLNNLGSILLCIGDCRTVLLTETVRNIVPRKWDILVFKHHFGTFRSSNLYNLSTPKIILNYNTFIRESMEYWPEKNLDEFLQKVKPHVFAEELSLFLWAAEHNAKVVAIKDGTVHNRLWQKHRKFPLLEILKVVYEDNKVFNMAVDKILPGVLWIDAGIPYENNDSYFEDDESAATPLHPTFDVIYRIANKVKPMLEKILSDK